MNTPSIFVQNAAVYLMDRGEGAPTLFLHGNPDSAEMWSEVIAHLGPSYRSLAPDLPGFGRSAPVPNFDTSLENRARWVEELVESIDLREAINLVGHDFGAQFGLAWAIRYPGRVRRIAISNTNFFSDYRWHRSARLMRAPLGGEIMMALLNDASFARQMQRDAAHLPQEYIERAMSLYTPKARKMALRLYRTTDSRSFVAWEDELCQLTAQVPTCVLWGDRDPYAPVQWAERFGAQEVYQFAEYSHWLPIEAPEEVAQR
jgi:pimeloyl-ACP methyl ester carboxylesterase